MARVTVEDCLKHTDNRFSLVLLAARRARQLSMTAMQPLVEAENDKNTVISLREVATGQVSFNQLDEWDKMYHPWHIMATFLLNAMLNTMSVRWSQRPILPKMPTHNRPK